MRKSLHTTNASSATTSGCRSSFFLPQASSCWSAMAPIIQGTDISINVGTLQGIVSLVAVAGLCLSFAVCSKCCKKRRGAKKDTTLKQNPALVIGGVGDPHQQIAIGFATNVLRVISTPAIKGARAPSCVFSPYALQTTFGVCFLGANAATQAEMMTTLFPNSGSVAYAEDVLKDIVASTTACRDRGRFRVFSRIYAHSAFPYSAGFKQTVERDLKSKPFVTVDYRKSNSGSMAKTTHQWLAFATQRQLTEFAATSWRPVNDKESSLIVVSAATLNCRWTLPFYQHHTRSGKPFFVRLGKSIKTEMMRQTNSFGYCGTEQMQVVRMEYRDSGGVALYIFLPRLVGGLDNLEKMPPDSILAACNSAMQRKELLDISLPKFKMECEVGDPLVVAMANLGLATAFKKGAADFSRILDQSVENPNALWISGAVHKVFIQFSDEPAQKHQLSERSGASSIGAVKSITVSHVSASSSSAESVGSVRRGVQTFVADHPFLFLIVVEPKMTPLFYGRFCGV